MLEADTKPSDHISSPPTAPSEPPIDLAHLARMTLGDKRLEAEVLALFDRQASLLLGRMREAPPAAVGAFAHTLKGSARGIGTWRVAEAAARVEQAAGDACATELAAAIEGLAAAIGEAQAAIAGLPLASQVASVSG
jgi:HPt (histidine-containing phosphotransfer) domain-containing protein